MSTVRDNPTEHRHELESDDQVAEYVIKVIAADNARYLHLVREDIQEMLGLTPFRA